MEFPFFDNRNDQLQAHSDSQPLMRFGSPFMQDDRMNEIKQERNNDERREKSKEAIDLSQQLANLSVNYGNNGIRMENENDKENVNDSNNNGFENEGNKNENENENENMEKGKNVNQEKADKKAQRKLKRQKYNDVINQGKRYEKAATKEDADNCKENLLNALVSFREANEIYFELRNEYSEGVTDKIQCLLDLCFDNDVNAEQFAYKKVISEFEQYSIITNNSNNNNSNNNNNGNDHWYQSLLTQDYHLESKNENCENEYVLPRNVFEKLYEYQRDCVRWLWGLHEMKIGGILGDDMGLGKTVQMAAFLSGAFYSELIGRVLLIVPVSVMEHWIRELTKWCDGRRILGYHTSIRKKLREKNLSKIVRKGGILITTYGMVLKNVNSLSLSQFNNNENEDRRWDYMILDEGHKIKNHTIGTAKAVREVPVRDCHRIILSGTFLQNNLSELWSLIDFISETRLLGPFKEFNQQFTQRINKSQMKDADPCERRLGNAMIQLLKDTIDPYLLRRTKVQIKSLNEQLKAAKMAAQAQAQEEHGDENKKAQPKILKASKREIVVWVKICEYQAKLYRQFLESENVKEALNSTKSPLAALTVLKKICDHPFLLTKNMIAACKQGQGNVNKQNGNGNGNGNVNGNSNNMQQGFNSFQNIENNPFIGNNDNNNNGSSNNEDIDVSNSENNENNKAEGESEPDILAIRHEHNNENALKYSTKMSVIIQILKSIRRCSSQHRVLVFAQYKKILTLIEELLKSENISYLRMDGDTDISTRQELVDTFNRDTSIFVFLLTTGVGGLGLNLIGANRVVIYDPDWNPAKDAQAVDRAYRVGQTKNVLVYRLVTCSTIEEKIYRRQVSKIGLLKSVTEYQDNQQRYFTRKELRQVFTLNDTNISETQKLFSNFNKLMIGKNVEFDNEIEQLNLINEIYGVSHHDILFKLSTNDGNNVNNNNNSGNSNENGGSNDNSNDNNESMDSNVLNEINCIREAFQSQNANIKRGARLKTSMKKVQNQQLSSFFGNGFGDALSDIRKKIVLPDMIIAQNERNRHNNSNKNNKNGHGNDSENENNNVDNGTKNSSNKLKNGESRDSNNEASFLRQLTVLDEMMHDQSERNVKEKNRDWNVNDNENDNDKSIDGKKKRAKARRKSLAHMFSEMQKEENDIDSGSDNDKSNDNDNQGRNSIVENEDNRSNKDKNDKWARARRFSNRFGFGDDTMDDDNDNNSNEENENENSSEKENDSDATLSDMEDEIGNFNENNKSSKENSVDNNNFSNENSFAFNSNNNSFFSSALSNRSRSDSNKSKDSNNSDRRDGNISGIWNQNGNENNEIEDESSNVQNVNASILSSDGNVESENVMNEMKENDEKEIESIKSKIEKNTKDEIATQFKRYRRKSIISNAIFDECDSSTESENDNDNENGNNNNNNNENNTSSSSISSDSNNKSNNDKRSRRSSRRSMSKNGNVNDDNSEESETETESETESDADIDMTGKSNVKSEKKGIANVEKVCLKHKQQCTDRGFNCTKCQCFVSKQDWKQYKSLLRDVKEYEKEKKWSHVLKCYFAALNICDSDVVVHVNCQTIANMLFGNGHQI